MVGESVFPNIIWDFLLYTTVFSENDDHGNKVPRLSFLVHRKTDLRVTLSHSFTVTLFLMEYFLETFSRRLRPGHELLSVTFNWL